MCGHNLDEDADSGRVTCINCREWNIIQPTRVRLKVGGLSATISSRGSGQL